MKNLDYRNDTEIHTIEDALQLSYCLVGSFSEKSVAKLSFETTMP